MSKFIKKYNIYILPFTLLILNILAIIFHFFTENNFKFEIIPLIIGGFVVIKSTVLATIKKRKVTAGLLVVLALIGTTYVGEYLSGSIVSFMMIFGEFLEDLTMKNTPKQSYLKTGEACLSVLEDVQGYVPRHAKITVEGYDALTEKNVKIVARGYLAICLQHELDHFDGILFYDHINKDYPLMPIEHAMVID